MKRLSRRRPEGRRRAARRTAAKRTAGRRPEADRYFLHAKESLFESSRDAGFITTLAERIVYANRSATALTGFDSSELALMSIGDLLLPNGQPWGSMERARNGGEILWEADLRRKDGSTIAVEGHCVVVNLAGDEYLQTVLRDVSARKRAEVALRESEELLRRVVESTDDIVMMQDVDGRFLYYNAPLRYHLGPADVVGKMPGDVFPPEVARRVLADLRTVAETGEGISRETQIVLDGAVQWFLDRVTAVRGSDGGVAGVVTISHNVTEAKIASERLREREERYRDFVAQNADGIVRFETERPIPTALPVDDQIDWIYNYGYLAECNNALAHMYGFRSAEEIIGARFGMFVQRSSPEQVDALHAFIRSGYRVEDLERQARDREGNSRFFLHTFIGTIEDGCLVRAWGIQRDITARKDAERSMRLLAQTITSTRDCIVITDMENRILFVNEAFEKTYGYPQDELVGKSVYLLRSSNEPTDSADRILPASLEDGWYGEIVNRRKDGTEFPIELWTSTVRNDEGEPVALVGVARDITERKRAEAQIRASLREKEVLLKEIHHRVKNNLQIVSSLLSLQSEYIKDPEMLKIFMESQSRVKSMALIHEKLYKSSNLAQIDFGEYLQELATHLFRSYGASARGVELKLDVETVGLGLDRGIPCGIIVNELVSNALKYAFPTRKAGQIFVSLHRLADGSVRLVVGDTGVGIPEGLDLQMTESLGLKLVMMLTNQLQGTLDLERNGRAFGSETGTRFAVTFTG